MKDFYTVKEEMAALAATYTELNEAAIISQATQGNKAAWKKGLNLLSRLSKDGKKFTNKDDKIKYLHIVNGFYHTHSEGGVSDKSWWGGEDYDMLKQDLIDLFGEAQAAKILEF